MKNYPILKFMLVTAFATIGAPYAFSPRNPLKIYCCYCVCAADAQSVSDS